MMKNTTLLACLENTYLFEGDATVLSVSSTEDNRTAVVLDQTIFYPQGGGQPADRGHLESGRGRFEVQDVRLINDEVIHLGFFQGGSFNTGEVVKSKVSPERRIMHARLHSGGHLIDLAVRELNLKLTPAKGYHYPNGAYVEYLGELNSSDNSELIKDLQSILQKLIAQDLSINSVYKTPEESRTILGELPDYLDHTKPIRLTSIGKSSCPCGGTHVRSTLELFGLVVTKIKENKGRTRISYAFN